ncbi:hypothetical protein [Niastella vici]|uniref:hypothetical protein n=1 Tax=Niastella vici TaxID=1703345 RepID=UPI001301AD94|nr:hypothetical protein [Niastella vici]
MKHSVGFAFLLIMLATIASCSRQKKPVSRLLPKRPASGKWTSVLPVIAPP